MSIVQRFGRATLSMIITAALLAACDDDTDNDSSTSDEQSASDESSDNAAGPRAGTSAMTRTARGGSGGAAAAGRRPAANDAGSVVDAGFERPRRSGAGGSSGTAGRRGAPPLGSALDAAVDSGDQEADSGTTNQVILNDGQIAEFIGLVNTGEVSLGTLALSRAMTPAVRDYAQVMVTSHNAAQERQTVVINSIGITMSPSALSEQLSMDTANAMTQLTNASVPAFDELYVRGQVEMHTDVLAIIDEQLLTNVSAPQLRIELERTRTDVAGHLASARALLATLEGVDATDAGVP